MNTVTPRRSLRRNGFSLLELTVVIAVLLSLTTVLLLGARAWKNGADRTACIMNIREVQMAVRSYQNLYGYSAGGMPYAEEGTQDIGAHLLAKGFISGNTLSAIQGEEACAGGGHYTCSQPDVFPPVRELYISCSLSGLKEHEPDPEVEW